MPPDVWTLTGHTCARCLGRVLGATGRFRCSVCGEMGESVQDICGCGLTVARPGGGELRVFRCVTNPALTAVMPAEIVMALAQPVPVLKLSVKGAALSRTASGLLVDQMRAISGSSLPR